MPDEPTTRDVLDAMAAMERRLVARLDPLPRGRLDPRAVATLLGLTPREAEIAVMLAQGRSGREIAWELGRGYSTVRTHVKSMFAKLGVSRQYEVAQAGLDLGFGRRPG